jgi:Rv0078B-related antitoxin
VVSWAVADASAETATERLRMAFELIDVAERMLRQRLRREQPDISEQALDEHINAWYARRPGAELGDGEGIPAVWPRR